MSLFQNSVTHVKVDLKTISHKRGKKYLVKMKLLQHNRKGDNVEQHLASSGSLKVFFDESMLGPTQL